MLEAASAISLASHVSVAVAAALLFSLARYLPPIEATRRWSAATLSILGLQLANLIVWALGLSLLLPWIEGMSSVATALLFAWPLLIPKPASRWDALVLAVALALLAALASILMFESLGLGSVPHALWGVLGALVSAPAALGLAFRRRARWPPFFTGYLLLLVGFVIGAWLLTALLPAVELIVYPAMAFVVVGSLAQSARDTKARSPLSEFSDAFRFFEQALDEEALLDSGLRLVTLSLHARYGLLFAGPDPLGEISLISAIDAQGVQEPSGPPLQAKALPELVSSIKGGRTTILHDEEEANQIREALGLDRTGQTMASGVELDGSKPAVFLLLAPIERPEWSVRDLDLLSAQTTYLSRKFSEGPRGAQKEFAEELETLRGELRLALQELSEVSAVQSQGSIARVGTLSSLLANMREPIASIQGYYEMLRRSTGERFDAEQLGFLDQIQRQATQLDRQLTDLLRMVAAPQAAIPSHTRISEVIDTAASQVSSELRRMEIQLVRELPEAALHVNADSDTLRRVIVLLFERALRISPNGSRIRISAQPEDEGWVSLAISDQGPGMPAEDLGRAFQASDGDLSQVKTLADSIGSKVWIGSELGAGSTVTVLIPSSEGAVARVT